MRRLALVVVVLITALSICISGCTKKTSLRAQLESVQEQKDSSGKVVRKITKMRSGSNVMTLIDEYRPATEKELGVPIYPGAKQDERFVTNTDSKGNKMLLANFRTKDSIDKVMAFYKKSMKGKTETMEETHNGTRSSGLRKVSGNDSLTVSVYARAGKPTKISVLVWNRPEAGRAPSVRRNQ